MRKATLLMGAVANESFDIFRLKKTNQNYEII